MDIQRTSAALMARPGVAYAQLPHMNIPWLESPFFETLLAEQTHLTAKEKEDCMQYAKDGYFLIEDLEIPDFETLAQQIIEDVRLHGNIPQGYDRIQDLWTSSEHVRRLALCHKVDRLLRLFYQREPIPFQTINFHIGSEQDTHSDTVHFHSVPHRFMCGVWIALENIDYENGPLHIYPGSHKAPCWNFHDMGLPSGPEAYLQYAHGIQRYIEAMGFRKTQVIIPKGKALIWAANLLHGGDTIIDRCRSRHSQVTHYFFSDCLYYTPMFSDPYIGKIHMRHITNIKTRTAVQNMYNGKVVEMPLSIDA